MATERSYFVFGEALVLVKGFLFIRAEAEEPSLWELGLTSDAIRITPNFSHTPIYTNDFGSKIPAEIMWSLTDVDIKMTLIHFDEEVLRACIANSMGAAGTFLQGTPGGAGTLLGRGKPIFTSGNQYISLNIINGQNLVDPWNFPTSYLTSPSPFMWPLGTEKSEITLTWKAIPYAAPNASGEVISSGVAIWYRTADGGQIMNSDLNS